MRVSSQTTGELADTLVHRRRTQLCRQQIYPLAEVVSSLGRYTCSALVGFLFLPTCRQFSAASQEAAGNQIERERDRKDSINGVEPSERPIQ